MITVFVDALALEHLRESITRGHILLFDSGIRVVCRRSNDELPNLDLGVGDCPSRNSSVPNATNVLVEDVPVNVSNSQDASG